MQHNNPTSLRPVLIDKIRQSGHQPANQKLLNEIERLQHDTGDDNEPLLQIRPANQWLALQREQPRTKMLFGSFWLEGELCILFADTNMGKSILAVQLGDSMSKHQPINGFELHIPACPVLYVDFELSTRQFEARYTDSNGTPYNFDNQFYRAEVDLQAQKPHRFATYIDFVGHTLHRAVKQTGAQVLIIDNITCLGGSAEQSGPALAMMRQLKLLKTRHQLSILVLAHTPKRAGARPVTRNDLGGSKMLINFADSAFAMAPSGTQLNCRYLKQVKQRGGTETYGADNVCVFKLNRSGSFLNFELLGTAPEHEHIRTPDRHDRERLIQQVISLKSQGHTQRHIANHLRLSLGKVNKLIAEGEAGGGATS
jgi:hypothetical protein